MEFNILFFCIWPKPSSVMIRLEKYGKCSHLLCDICDFLWQIYIYFSCRLKRECLNQTPMSSSYYYHQYQRYYLICVVLFFFFYLVRLRTSTFSHSPLATGNLPLGYLMTVLTLELEWVQRTTVKLKTGGKGKMHHGNDIVPGNREVVTSRGDKQGGMREFPL